MSDAAAASTPEGPVHRAFALLRLVVASDARLMLDVSFDRLRRIQFDIERARPAALVVVPEWPSDPPQVLSVQPDQYEAMAKVLTYVGVRIHPNP